MSFSKVKVNASRIIRFLILKTPPVLLVALIRKVLRRLCRPLFIELLDSLHIVQDEVASLEEKVASIKELNMELEAMRNRFRTIEAKLANVMTDL
jgi:hypothetical protein